MSNFTPGPWKVSITRGCVAYASHYGFPGYNDGELYPVYEYSITGNDSSEIHHGTYDRVDRDKTLANADLIASAPELYEALKEMLDVVEGCFGDEGIDCDSNPAYCKAQQALAKAEGK